jgi:hypothetical protein
MSYYYLTDLMRSKLIVPLALYIKRFFGIVMRNRLLGTFIVLISNISTSTSSGVILVGVRDAVTTGNKSCFIIKFKRERSSRTLQ